jgi:hypothetical protein
MRGDGAAGLKKQILSSNSIGSIYRNELYLFQSSFNSRRFPSQFSDYACIDSLHGTAASVLET